MPYYPEDFEADSSHWSVYRRSYSPRFESAFAVTEALIGALRDSCAAQGAALVVAAFPQKVEVDSLARALELHHYGYDPRQFDLAAPYRRLRSLSWDREGCRSSIRWRRRGGRRRIHRSSSRATGIRTRPATR